jgi:hypothetical protein
MNNKLFVGNLAYSINDDDLLQLFATYCKTPGMYAGYLARIGQDVLPKREGLIEWKCKQPSKKAQDDHNFEVC